MDIIIKLIMFLCVIIYLGDDMNIQLETLNLVRYNEQQHSSLKKELEIGNSSSNYIHQIGERLEASKDNNRSIYQSAFVVEAKEIPVGYLFISTMTHDEVFLEYAVLKDFRRMGYGSRIISETTEYLFQEHNIRSIRLDIDPSNKNSILIADLCGFIFDEEEYESRNFYISKRRK